MEPTMLNVSEIASSTEERVLTGVKVGQTLVIDGLKNGLALADRIIPGNVSSRIEGRVSDLPSASPLVDSYFSFAGKMLAAQRDFAGEIVQVLQPAPAKKAPAAKASVAKKAPARKSAKKSS